MNLRELKYYEQSVNNRFGTSAAPDIDRGLLPETAKDYRLKWRRIPLDELFVIADGSERATRTMESLRENGHVLLPVHPLEAQRWPGAEFVESGSVQTSASYRTMFFEPEAGGLLADVADQNSVLMMKLHLENPLPGIDGDRRISRQIAQKCVTLSTQLQRVINEDRTGASCEVVPEFLAFAADDTGVIFRMLPRRGVMPLFAMFSPDASLESAGSHIESEFRRRYGNDAASAAAELGNELASPLLRPLFAGFRGGFSIEMHAQNVLFRPGNETLIDRVYIRDLEGVVFSNRYREAQGLEPLFGDLDNTELVSDYRSMTRWFNRNVDHDLGRVFTASLDALTCSGYFGERERKLAVASIRRSARECVRDAGVSHLNRAGRFLPISRSPYGNGLGKGHYYRARYR